MSFPLSRVQWAMRGDSGKRAPKRPVITAYDGEGGFAFRLEHAKDVEFMTNLILGGLAKINEEQEKRRATPKPQYIEATHDELVAILRGEDPFREEDGLLGIPKDTEESDPTT